MKKPTVDKNEDNQSVESGLSFKEKTKDSTKTSTTTPSNQKTGDAVVFGWIWNLYLINFAMIVGVYISIIATLLELKCPINMR